MHKRPPKTVILTNPDKPVQADVGPGEQPENGTEAERTAEAVRSSIQTITIKLMTRGAPFVKRLTEIVREYPGDDLKSERARLAALQAEEKKRTYEL
ncbi:hypothetical protein KJ742_07670 [Patescibacteria group bacterium]|nr:hypothetical protein [Patescibacteria group bacterium]MBU1683789.1 hypothetical protein [Patescibacteria group bacterium]MBU1935594.1 hypothetical protein [Patescibacteria group bacterium]